MLRMMVRVPRRLLEPAAESDGSDVTSDGDGGDMETRMEPEKELEPWTEWIQRATHEAEQRMRQLNFEDWTVLQRRRKWKWAQKVATSEGDSWTLDALTWDPHPRLHEARSRRVGRPDKRWADDQRTYVYQSVYGAENLPSITPRLDNVEWLHHARDKIKWSALEDGYRQGG